MLLLFLYYNSGKKRPVQKSLRLKTTRDRGDEKESAGKEEMPGELFFAVAEVGDPTSSGRTPQTSILEE